MQTKYKIAIATTAVLSSFALGRYTTPVKIKIQEKIVEVKVKDEDKKTDQNKHKVTVIVEKPNGDKTTTISEDSNLKTDDKSKITDSKTDTKTKEVVKQGSSLNISALAARDNQSGTIVYGAQVQRDLIGPINLGLYGLTNGLVGVSLGVRF